MRILSVRRSKPVRTPGAKTNDLRAMNVSSALRSLPGQPGPAFGRRPGHAREGTEMTKEMRRLAIVLLLATTFAALPASADDGSAGIWQDVVTWLSQVFGGAETTSDDEMGPILMPGG